MIRHLISDFNVRGCSLNSNGMGSPGQWWPCSHVKCSHNRSSIDEFRIYLGTKKQKHLSITRARKDNSHTDWLLLILKIVIPDF